jgi:acetoin utilization deacetylase AcuC-like enzyme
MAPVPWIWSPAYEVDIGVHVYPTTKYRRIRDRLVEEGTLLESEMRAPPPASREELTVVHDPAWVDRILGGGILPGEEARLELPFSPTLRDAFVLCCGGTLSAGRLALEHGIAVHLGGGFHHAFRAHGEGFCLLNDVAVAAGNLRGSGAVSRVAVVDLDVHHGNGTAHLFRDDPDIFTFSMHQERNYPLEKPPGDLDVALDDGTGDKEYLAILGTHFPSVLEHDPDLVLYLAGVDPFEEDQLGGLSLTREGMRKRDRLVLEGARDAGVPVAVVLAGGYAAREEDTVALHCATVREAARI